MQDIHSSWGAGRACTLLLHLCSYCAINKTCRVCSAYDLKQLQSDDVVSPLGGVAMRTVPSTSMLTLVGEGDSTLCDVDFTIQPPSSPCYCLPRALFQLRNGAPATLPADEAALLRPKPIFML